MRKATEAVDDGVYTDPTFTKISLTTVKIRLDWELSTEGLEDNIEGDSLEDHVASLMARQTANDVEDLFIHGDTASADPYNTGYGDVSAMYVDDVSMMVCH